MKYSVINKTKCSVIIIVSIFLLLLFFGVFLFIFLKSGDGGKLFAMILLSVLLSIYLPYMSYLLYFHSGKIRFVEDGAYLKKNSKTYFVSKKDILIIDIRSDYHVSTIQRSNESNYILIRKKGEKDFIPIRIFQEEIIKLILNSFECRRNPQDFLFKWENKKRKNLNK